MYASGHQGPGQDDETETSAPQGVAETAVWGAFMGRIIKTRPRR